MLLYSYIAIWQSRKLLIAALCTSPASTCEKVVGIVGWPADSSHLLSEASSLGKWASYFLQLKVLGQTKNI